MLLWAAAGLLLVAVAAGLMERLRQHRRHRAGVGWAPWSGITVAALFAATICVALALRG